MSWCCCSAADARRARWPVSTRGTPTEPDDIDAAVGGCRRLIVVGTDADLASVLTRLLRTDRLDVEVGHATGWWSGAAGAPWHRAAGAVDPRRHRPRHRRRRGMARRRRGPLRGEAVVDDTRLFDGEVAGVRIEPTQALPGLRACVIRPGRRRWAAGRAAQLGTTGAVVVRDGDEAPKIVRRSTFYRHTQGWLLVR